MILDEHHRDALHSIVQTDGVVATANDIGVEVLSLVRAMDGDTIRRGTGAMIEAWLADAVDAVDEDDDDADDEDLAHELKETADELDDDADDDDDEDEDLDDEDLDDDD